MVSIKGKSVKKAVKQIGWTFGLFREYYLGIFLYVLFRSIKTVIDLALIYAVGKVVDYIVKDDMSTLIRFVFIFVVSFAIKLIITYISNRVSVYNYSAMLKSLMLKLYDKTISSDWESLEEHHSGEILTRISQDAKTVAGNTNGLLSTVLSDIYSVLAAVVVVLYFDYSIIIVLIGAAPLVFISTKLFAGKVLDYQRLGREADADIMLLNKETFHNMQAIKAFGLFDVFHQKMEIRTDRLRKYDLKSNLMYMISWVMTQSLALIAIIFCGAWMIYRVHANYITVGNIASMAALSASAAASLANAFSLMPTIAEYLTASERIKEILEIPDESELYISPEIEEIIKQHQEDKVGIQIEDMSFHYHTGPNIFENADLTANPGEIVAMVGPSGEGKTTMLRIILGIVRAQSGGACLFWEDGQKIALGPMTRSFISYVPQGNTMMSGTIADNMRIIKQDATDEEIIMALKKACAYEFVSKLHEGINHLIGEAGHGFSEGQNQRLAIARAVLKDSPILLLDEATSALDVATEREVLRNIMSNDKCRICLLTTHRPSVLSMCDKVYKISERKTKVIGAEEIRKLMDEF